MLRSSDETVDTFTGVLSGNHSRECEVPVCRPGALREIQTPCNWKVGLTNDQAGDSYGGLKKG